MKYFFISYSYKNHNGHGFGQCSLKTTNYFLNFNTFIENLKETNFNFSDIVVLFFREMTQEEYEAYNK